MKNRTPCWFLRVFSVWVGLILSSAVLTEGLSQTMSSRMTDMDSLGNIWIVTIDKSGSMVQRSTYGLPKSCTKQNVYDCLHEHVQKSLSECNVLKSLDFSTDRFIFLRSGYPYYPLRKNEPPLDDCFIRHTDGQFHSFKKADDLFNLILYIIDTIDYNYNTSWVSQIQTFSLVKALRSLHEIQQDIVFNKLYVVTITDDADGTTQWEKDYQLIKSFDTNKVEEISRTNSKYIYNVITKQGAGYFKPVFVSDHRQPHLTITCYQTLQGKSNVCDAANVYKLCPTNGKTLKLFTRKTFNGDKICFTVLDSFKINGRAYPVGQKYTKSTIKLNQDYAQKSDWNHVELFGTVQVEYNDSILGTHYKQIRFTQAIDKMSVAMVVKRGGLAVSLLTVLVAVLWFVFKYIPNRELFKIYTGSKVYTVKRGFHCQWSSENTQILSVRTYANADVSILCARHPNISSETNKTEYEGIRLESRYNLDGIAPPTVENGRKCYNVDIYSDHPITFRFPLLLNKTATIVFDHGKRRLAAATRNENRNIMALQDYYSSNDCYDAIITASRDSYKTNDFNIYWNVLLPGYDVANMKNDIRSAHNVFSFKQHFESDTELDEIVDKLSRLLTAELKKSNLSCRRVKQAEIRIMTDECLDVDFPPAFDISETVFPSYICLKEETDRNPRMQEIYSPFMELGWRTTIPFLAGKMRNMCYPYLTFLPLKTISKSISENMTTLVIDLRNDEDNKQFLDYVKKPDGELEISPRELIIKDQTDCKHYKIKA